MNNAYVHCKKGEPFFRFQPGCHLPNSTWSGILKLFLASGRVLWLVTSRLGTGKWLTLYYSVYSKNRSSHVFGAFNINLYKNRLEGVPLKDWSNDSKSLLLSFFILKQQKYIWKLNPRLEERWNMNRKHYGWKKLLFNFQAFLTWWAK